MVTKQNIKNIIELFISWNGETKPIDIDNIDTAVDFIYSYQQEKQIKQSNDFDCYYWNDVIEDYNKPKDK